MGRTVGWEDWGLKLEGTENRAQNPSICTGMWTRRLVNSPMTAEDFKDDDWKKTEAQQKVLPVGAARPDPRGTALAFYMSQGLPHLSAAACQLATRVQEPIADDLG